VSSTLNFLQGRVFGAPFFVSFVTPSRNIDASAKEKAPQHKLRG